MIRAIRTMSRRAVEVKATPRLIQIATQIRVRNHARVLVITINPAMNK